MIAPSRKVRSTPVLSVVLFVGLVSCIDPVEPEFEYILGLPYIDALAATTPGGSYVTIYQSDQEFGFNTNTFVSGASVFFENQDLGTIVPLEESEEIYVPPEGFTTREGETWALRVVMPNGKTYRSQPETVTEAVPVSAINVTYDPEMLYSDEFDANIPGHRISVDFDDPGGGDNYYYWRYRSFERLVYCKQCFGKTVFRDGICKVINPEASESTLKDYYTYGCEERCWQIRYSDKISLFSDEFVNGGTVAQLPVADIILHTKRNILVELQQFSLSPEAYRYYKALKDLIDNNSGFNAPLPAALIGNLFNPEDTEEVVLGRFTAAATAVRPIFIERIFVEEEQLEPIIYGQTEGLEAPAPIVTLAPCEENRYRTSTQPNGWQD